MDKNYGFIEGLDGKQYFFHLDDVERGVLLVSDQTVTFTPTQAYKGPRAISVVAGQPPLARAEVYVRPRHFVRDSRPVVPGYKTIRILAPNISFEHRDPNTAKEGLQQIAVNIGANAILNFRMRTRSKRDDPFSTHQHTEHVPTGDLAFIAKLQYERDPETIARCNAEIQAVLDRPEVIVNPIPLTPWQRFARSLGFC